MYFESNKGTFYYEDHGRKDKLAIVFSHGVTMDHHTFDKQVESLEGKYRVITWDMPFHGKSSGLEKSANYSEVTGGIIIELLEHLDINRAVLVGQSLGSTVTQHAAVKAHEKIAATVHLGGVSLHPKFTPLLTLLNPILAFYIWIFPSKMLYRLFAHHKAIREDTRAYLEDTASRAGKSVISSLTREMIRDMVAGIPAPLEQPMLITYGEHEAGFLKKLSHKWHEGNPHSHLAVIEDAHHIANQDNPEDFNRAVVNFLKEVGVQ